MNARALVDSSGFGGHTPLFNCVVSYNAGRADDPLARLLLDRGADPNARASIRTRLPFARDKAVHEYRDVTPLGWGRRFHDQSYVSAAAMRIDRRPRRPRMTSWSQLLLQPGREPARGPANREPATIS